MCSRTVNPCEPSSTLGDGAKYYIRRKGLLPVCAVNTDYPEKYMLMKARDRNPQRINNNIVEGYLPSVDTGEVFEITNIKQFSTLHFGTPGHASSIRKVLRGERIKCKGLILFIPQK